MIPPWNGKTILITGINGYIASVTGLRLLEKGYAVVGTSRSTTSARGLIHGSYKDYASRVTFVEIPDMTQPGAFDNAVQGVSAIIHAASPVNFSLTDPEQVIVPAVRGATGILKSALEHAGPQLTSFVFLSSGAAIIEPKDDPNYVFTEKDWNTFAERKVKELGGRASGNLLYNASKAASERAVWEFRDHQKPPFAITAINPGTLIGPSAQFFPDGFKAGTSLEYLWGIFSGSCPDIPPKIGSGSYADVRDCADLQIWALENPNRSANERYLAVTGPGFPQAAADILHQAYPDRAHIMPKGRPGQGYRHDYSWSPDEVSVSGSKAQKAMGTTWIGYERSVLDTARYLESFV